MNRSPLAAPLLLLAASCGSVSRPDPTRVQFATFCPAAPEDGVLCPTADSFDFTKGAPGKPDRITCEWACALYQNELRNWTFVWARDVTSEVGEICYGEPAIAEQPCPGGEGAVRKAFRYFFGG